MNAALEGQVFAGRYRLITHLSSGGFSKVYRGVQLGVDRPVAIKILDPINESSNIEKRFYLEAKLIAQLKDPHTVTMHDYGKDGENLFMVFEFIDGRDLSGELARGSMSVDRALKILEQVLRSLDEAHTLNIVHRDLKPSNIMVYQHLTRTDCVKVLDFGIAKTVEEESNFDQGLTAEGVLVGTPRYMAPEQLALRKLTPAADIYALGLVLLELLTGRRPFEEQTVREMMEYKLKNDIVIPSVFPDDVSALLQKMLARKPGARYQNAGEVLADLPNIDRTDVDLPDNVVVFPLGLDSTGMTQTADITGLSKIDDSFEVADLAPVEETLDVKAQARTRNIVIVLVLLLLAAAAFFAISQAFKREPPTVEIKTEQLPETDPAPVKNQATSVSPDTLRAFITAQTRIGSAVRRAAVAKAPRKSPKPRKKPTKKRPTKKTFNPKPVD